MYAFVILKKSLKSNFKPYQSDYSILILKFIGKVSKASGTLRPCKLSWYHLLYGNTQILKAVYESSGVVVTGK